MYFRRRSPRCERQRLRMEGVMSCVIFWGLFTSLLGDLTVGGNRPVTVYVPPSYDPSIPVPVIIALHGYSDFGVGIESYYGIQPLADEWGFLYAHPDGIADSTGSQFWNATDYFCCYPNHPDPAPPQPDDSTYLKLILEEIEAQFNVDRDRVCFCGHSNGGAMSYRMACDHADRVTAIASQAGGTFDDPSACIPSTPVHVLQIHGTADSLVPYGGGTRSGRKQPGAVGSVERWAEYDGCSTSGATSSERLDLVSDIPGAETTVSLYSEGCRPEGSVELWSMAGADHVPTLVHTRPKSADLASHVVRWLLS